MVDNELAEEQPGAVRPMCAEHRVMDDVVGGTDVAVAARLCARRSAELAGLTRHVRMTKDDPHDVHVQWLASANTTGICV